MSENLDLVRSNRSNSAEAIAMPPAGSQAVYVRDPLTGLCPRSLRDAGVRSRSGQAVARDDDQERRGRRLLLARSRSLRCLD